MTQPNIANVQLERPSTLSQFQVMFHHIYHRAHDAYSNERLVLRLAAENWKIIEAARKDDRMALFVSIPDLFAWLIVVANRFEIDLQSATWEKYPGVCFACLRDNHCNCGVEQPKDILDIEGKLRAYRRHRVGREPQTLSDHQAFHKRLYGRQNDRIFLIQTTSHLAEEVCEVADAFDDVKQMRNESADVISWLCACATKLDKDLNDLIWKRYPYECPRCHSSICVGCPLQIAK